ncbi:hypothetical protein OSTOST_09090 [Ostertagia ostertagi]
MRAGHDVRVHAHPVLVGLVGVGQAVLAVDVGDEHGHVVGNRLEVGLRVADPLLGELALGDVEGDAEHADDTAVTVELGHIGLQVLVQLAIARAGAGLEHDGVARQRLGQPGHDLVHVGPVAHLVDAAAQQFLRPDGEQRVELLVGEQVAAVGVEVGDEGRHVVGDGAQAPLAALLLQLGAAQLGDVERHQVEAADRVGLRVAHGHEVDLEIADAAAPGQGAFEGLALALQHRFHVGAVQRVAVFAQARAQRHAHRMLARHAVHLQRQVVGEDAALPCVEGADDGRDGVGHVAHALLAGRELLDERAHMPAQRPGAGRHECGQQQRQAAQALADDAEHIFDVRLGDDGQAGVGQRQEGGDDGHVAQVGRQHHAGLAEQRAVDGQVDAAVGVEHRHGEGLGVELGRQALGDVGHAVADEHVGRGLAVADARDEAVHQHQPLLADEVADDLAAVDDGPLGVQHEAVGQEEPRGDRVAGGERQRGRLAGLGKAAGFRQRAARRVQEARGRHAAGEQAARRDVQALQQRGVVGVGGDARQLVDDDGLRRDGFGQPDAGVQRGGEGIAGDDGGGADVFGAGVLEVRLQRREAARAGRDDDDGQHAH